MDRVLAFKMIGEVGATSLSAVTAVLAVGESTPLTYSAIVAVLGFAGLLVRQILQAQKAIWKIVAAKDAELAQRDDALHYVKWELESMRYRVGERQVDPGPYVPRRPYVAPEGAQ